MEKTHGRILSVQPGGTSATVEVETAEFCSRCAAGKGCGAGVFGSDRGPRQFDAPVVHGMSLCEGDEVQIELAPQSVLHAALLVYGAPLAGVLIMAGIAQILGFSDGEAASAVVFGLLVGAFVSRRRLQRSNCLRQFTPAITGRLAGAE